MREQREYTLPQLGTDNSIVIWCNLYRSYMALGKCRGCIYDDDCRYREKGAMRRIKRKENID